MKKLNNKKGFTLMEMLIVVAIIAILVAIAIPTFSNSLNKAKFAADEANVRSWYSEVLTSYMLDTDTYTFPTTYGGSALQVGSVTCSGTTATDFTVTLTGNGTTVVFS